MRSDLRPETARGIGLGSRSDPEEDRGDDDRCDDRCERKDAREPERAEEDVVQRLLLRLDQLHDHGIRGLELGTEKVEVRS